MELFREVAGCVLIMPHTLSKVIRPFALAIALLWSAPLFAILDQTLYGEGLVVSMSTIVLQPEMTRTTVIYKT